MAMASARSTLEIVPHSGDLEVPPADVPRQDSLYRDATRPAHGGHHGQDNWVRTLRLGFQCVGILYADLGTSPLYVFSNTFKYGVGHKDDVLGVLSLIIYSFLLFAMVKIIFIALYANDDGDGGTFALYSLISRYARVALIPNQQAEDDLVSSHRHLSATRRRAQWMKNLLETSKPAKLTLFFLTIFATALAISDCMLTPPISVLSAVNGLRLRAPHLTTDQIVWITVGILILFFAVQHLGTDKIGYTFAPLVVVWLLLIAGIGLYNLIKYDIGTLRAFNPKYIFDYFRRNKKKGWVSLGEILLCFTGTEALFADLGYFSIKSIQLSFSFGLLPSVLLTYIGQAAYLRTHMDMTISNAFFNSIPSTLFWPTFVLALLASVIGSQAMVSCAFATMSHLQTLSCFPRVKILHTSRRYSGQLYIPEVNFFLCVASCIVTISFRTTGFIAKAHEICVALVMVITTLLMTIVMLLVWKVNIWWIAAFFVVFMSTETVYLSAVLYKFTQGPYFPLAMSAVLMVIMIVWHYVHVKRYKYELQHTVSPDEVKHLLERHDLKRVPGLGLFYTELVQGIPPIFPHLIEKIPTVHSVIVFISVKHLPIPHVDVQERFLFRQVEPKESMVFRCVARYGYRDTLEMAGDFVATLVEYLQYYVRDLSLYCTAEPLRTSYPSIRIDSFRWEKKPSGRSGRSGHGHGIHAEEMLTPIQSFSELTMHQVGMSNRLPQFQTAKMNLEEMLRIEEDQKVIQREVDNGVVYILGETEVVAKPHSNLLKKIAVNYIFDFLRKNSRKGEKMLSIPRGQLLKVGITYEI
ncbi:probable potassium transporter 16 [Aegilops tauschii subsp. strangulata]|uniref:Potassium transporter n=3 Tax=Aegilops tauschii subsp. strangulata TaxID=200361 RepID=A0A453PHX0_AEGTS|nr:probable potassium transporter 16 [Aegilops tauschii subsp. strangulata]